MSTKSVVRPDAAKVVPMASKTVDTSELLKPYGSGPIRFAGTEDALYERHLVFDRAIDPKVSSARERFEAFSHSVRDVLAQRWVKTKTTYEQQNAKRIYYLSMEFLLGRSLANNVTNLLLDPVVQQAIKEKGHRLARIDRAGTGCGPGERRSGPPRGVLPRLDGHHATPGHRLRSALRVRHVPPVD